jgi:hypothetical protein
MRLDALPAWFSPTGITCSAQVAAADCSVAQYLAGLHPAGDGSAMIVTIVITGTASPTAAGAGVASGEGCIQGPGEADLCNPAQASLAETRSDALPWWLWALPGLLGLAIVGIRREFRLIRG